ncbi:NFAT activation molecule 1 [Hyperolius riggenbachi]|uniref:NFAT activation molecule 1 n=1 Tax=Hyperolius riggenbachi TaxID=752182 RepID=UPI0035A39641
MDCPLITAVLVLSAGLSQGCSITQSPQILVSFTDQPADISCAVTFQDTDPEQQVTSRIFHHDSRQTIGASETRARNNGTSKIVISHTITARESGAYLCQVTCHSSTKTGSGTYIHVRDSGYVEPSGPADTLCSVLIALCVVLLLLSGTGTYLVVPFFWKKQGASPKPNGGLSSNRNTSGPPTQQPAEATGEALYTSLQAHSEDVYDVMEEDAPKRKNVKHQAEIHHPAGPSPLRKAKPQVSQAKPPPVMKKPSSASERPPIKPKPRNVTSENSLYENIKR